VSRWIRRLGPLQCHHAENGGFSSEPIQEALQVPRDAGVPAPSQKFVDPEASPSAITLEAAYAGFTQCEIIDNERIYPGYGRRAAYRGDQGEATIYIYTKGKSNIPNGPISEAVMLELTRQPTKSFRSDQRRLDKLNSWTGTGSVRWNVARNSFAQNLI
jgi:hypothetical protein